MKRILFVSILVVAITFATASPVFAQGMPAVHGVDGRTFGGAVSGLAQTDPGALVDHVSGGRAGGTSEGRAGGMPALHGVDGQTFGYLVSQLAQTDPLALADHVKK
jgi:hypothetical protein